MAVRNRLGEEWVNQGEGEKKRKYKVKDEWYVVAKGTEDR